MTKAIAQTINTANEYRLHISYFLLAICALFVSVYCVNVYSVISMSAEANDVLRQSQAIENNVKSLDTQYITLTSNITPQSLSTHGLSEGKVTAFITKTNTNGVVALGGYEF